MTFREKVGLLTNWRLGRMESRGPADKANAGLFENGYADAGKVDSRGVTYVRVGRGSPQPKAPHSPAIRE
jgi:hypothetical protein